MNNPAVKHSAQIQRPPVLKSGKKKSNGLVLGLFLGGLGLATLVGGGLLMLVLMFALMLGGQQQQTGFGYQSDGYNNYYNDGGYSGRMSSGTVDPYGQNSVYNVDGEILNMPN